jgi:hypothetical protein
MLVAIGLIVLVVIAARRAKTCQTPKTDAPTDQHRGWFGKL